MISPLNRRLSIDIAPEEGGEWTDDIEEVLSRIAHNSSLMCEHHKAEYKTYDKRIKWYKLPIIILSAVNSVISVGLSAFIEQTYVSVISCLLSLIAGTIGSIELYLQIQKKVDQEDKAYRNFYLLSLKINAMLKLDRANRDTDPKVFLHKMLDEYSGVFQEAVVNGLGVADRLVEVTLPP